jgi:D-methionine transport system ATP-binding protein
LWPQVTVRNHLASIAPSSAAINVDELLQAFDLEPLATAYPATLSQGERDRVTLARAIASGAQVLVLDEPLAHVPTDAAERYWSQLRTASGEQKMSVVLATHDMEVARREATHLIMLSHGRLIESGETKALFACPSSDHS